MVIIGVVIIIKPHPCRRLIIMFLYSVTANLREKDLLPDYIAWLNGGHVQAIIDRGGAISCNVAVVESDLARLGPGDWTHLPGPRRAINLRQCLQNAGITTQSSRRGKRGSSKSRKARQTFGNICRVQRGACLLNQLSPVGRGCNCFSRFGPVPGIITNR